MRELALETNPSKLKKLVRFPAALLLGLVQGALSALESGAELLRFTGKGAMMIFALLLLAFVLLCCLALIPFVSPLAELAIIGAFFVAPYLILSSLISAPLWVSIPAVMMSLTSFCLLGAEYSKDKLFDCIARPFLSIYDTYTTVIDRGVHDGVENIKQTINNIFDKICSIASFGFKDIFDSKSSEIPPVPCLDSPTTVPRDVSARSDVTQSFDTECKCSTDSSFRTAAAKG